MKPTRTSLILRLRDLGDRLAWQEFYDVYAPILYGYARARGLTSADAEEIRDACLEAIARKLPRFEYDPDKGRFRTWLFRIAHGRIVDRQRKRRPERLPTAELADLVDAENDPEALWERHSRAEHLRYCLDRVRDRVSSRVFTAFELLLVHDYSVPAVCAELEMNANQVYKAKFRVLREVRAILARLGEDA